MLCGLFIGGRATRMGGEPKGLLATPAGEAIVVRQARIARELGMTPVWVGMRQSAHAARYRSAVSGLDEIDDRPGEIGPLGGLAGLLAHAAKGRVLALACDLPFVSRELLARLIEEHPRAEVLAPRESLWQPLCARYDAHILPRVEAAVAHGTRSFQRLFAELAVQPLELSEAERAQLRDWDTPDDVAR
jgi:molybdopterin-guanine dinucleotide biosynthesis protein A